MTKYIHKDSLSQKHNDYIRRVKRNVLIGGVINIGFLLLFIWLVS